MNLTNEMKYTDEQIMIRAMPCPDCFAKPRELCRRKPNKDGIIRNHEDRQLLFHKFIQSAKTHGSVDLFGCKMFAVTNWKRKEVEQEKFKQRELKKNGLV